MLVIKSPTPEEQSHPLEMSSRGTSGPCISFRPRECAEFHKTLEIPLGNQTWQLCFDGKEHPQMVVFSPLPCLIAGWYPKLLIWIFLSIVVTVLWEANKLFDTCKQNKSSLEVESTIPNQHKHRP